MAADRRPDGAHGGSPEVSWRCAGWGSQAEVVGGWLPSVCAVERLDLAGQALFSLPYEDVVYFRIVGCTACCLQAAVASGSCPADRTSHPAPL